MQIRKDIDQIDDEIAKLLKKRFLLVKKIAQIKKEKNLPLSDPQRETEIIQRLSKTLDSGLVKDIYYKIFAYSKKIQKEIVNK